jgi:hypothetical protein
MPNGTDELVKQLEKEHPDWQVWIVLRVVGGPVWCAGRWDGTSQVLNADTPEHLTEYIEEAEAEAE